MAQSDSLAQRRAIHLGGLSRLFDITYCLNSLKGDIGDYIGDYYRGY